MRQWRPCLERDLTTVETVDLSTINGAELGALAATAALESQGRALYERAVPYYGLGAYPEGTHPMAVIQLLLATIDLLGHHIRGDP